MAGDPLDVVGRLDAIDAETRGSFGS